MTVTDGSPPRLDVLLAQRRGITRHAAQTMIDAGLVTVNGRSARNGQRIRAHDVVSVDEGDVAERGRVRRGRLGAAPERGFSAGRGESRAAGRQRGPTAYPADAFSAQPRPRQPAALNIVYEDEWLAVIDKPVGLVVHPAAGHQGDTLADALRARGDTWSLLGGEDRAGIVHRLDRDTSGLLVVARTEAAHRALADQLRSRTLGREYWSLVRGGFREESGTIDAPIARDPRDRKRMAVVDGGREAITDFTVVERLSELTVVQARLRTGRTHQIRVHFAYIKHGVVGDALYGPPDARLPRPALHAMRLTFVHPADGSTRTLESPLPADLGDYLAAARERMR
jgi:23S rRNA pseudouridine1911/1915/1917 synthase